MPAEKKVKLVEKIVERLKKNPSFVLVDFNATPHQKLEELRDKLGQYQSSAFYVVKNSLFKVAARKAHREQVLQDDVLKGPSAILSLPSDWAEALSLFYKFAQEIETLSFKIGLIDNQVYQKDQLVKLALLPSREELIATIISSMKAPQRRMVYAVRFGITRLTSVLSRKAKN